MAKVIYIFKYYKKYIYWFCYKIEVPQGERGELWLKGPNIMKGYINNPEATADCIDKEGYFHTGDVVVVDKDQHFYVVDRIKELIKYKGFQVSWIYRVCLNIY